MPDLVKRRGAMDEFYSAMGRLTELEVDVAHLDGIVNYLTTLSEALGTIRERTLIPAHRLARVGGNPGQGGGGESALGSSAIEDGVVVELSGREQSTYTALDQGLRTIAEELGMAAGAVAEIATRYNTVEQRNAATAAQWAEVISS